LRFIIGSSRSTVVEASPSGVVADLHRALAQLLDGQGSADRQLRHRGVADHVGAGDRNGAVQPLLAPLDPLQGGGGEKQLEGGAVVEAFLAAGGDGPTARQIAGGQAQTAAVPGLQRGQVQRLRRRRCGGRRNRLFTGLHAAGGQRGGPQADQDASAVHACDPQATLAA
jgi:hypothetical protein